jgi:hypothetical protein
LKLRYGSYTHDQDEAAIAISKTTNFNSLGRAISYTERWTITGRLQIDSPSGDPDTDQPQLTTDINALVNAYRYDGYDLTLLRNDGSTVTSHRIISQATIGGTRVVERPSFPEGSGAEYSTFRNYRIVVEGEIPVRQGGIEIVEWSETLSFTGTSGPRTVHLELRNGPAQKQVVSQMTVAKVTQSGSAIGRTAYIMPQPPIFPQDELFHMRQVSYESPTAKGYGSTRVYVDWPSEWRYEFESALPLAGFPDLQRNY